jgi:hypothetical protein
LRRPPFVWQDQDQIDLEAPQLVDHAPVVRAVTAAVPGVFCHSGLDPVAHVSGVWARSAWETPPLVATDAFPASLPAWEQVEEKTIRYRVAPPPVGVDMVS